MGKIGTRSLDRRVKELERQVALCMQLGQITVSFTGPDGTADTKQISFRELDHLLQAAKQAPAKEQA